MKDQEQLRPAEDQEQAFVAAIGQRIAQAARDQGLSRRQLASKMALSTDRIRTLLNGTCSMTTRQLYRFAHAVHRSPADLVPDDSSALFATLETLFHTLSARKQKKILELVIGICEMESDEPTHTDRVG